MRRLHALRAVLPLAVLPLAVLPLAVLLGFAHLLGGCHPPPPPAVGPQGSAPAKPATSGGFELEAVVREVDPGPLDSPYPKLEAQLRAAVEQRIAPFATPASRLARATAIVSALRAEPTNSNRLSEALGEAVQAHRLLELLVLAPECLEQAQALELLAELGPGGAVRTRLLTPLQERGGESLAFLGALADAAGRGERFLAARLLRAKQPVLVAKGLHAAAAYAHAAERFAREAVLRAEAVKRLGEAASREQWLRLADAHALADQVGEAAAALERAKQARVESAEHAASWERTATASVAQARELQRLGAAGSVEQALVRARVLLRMGRTVEALALGKEWRRKTPRDARALVIMARATMAGARDMATLYRRFGEALAIVEQGKTLEHRDGSYWGLLIGLAAHVLPKRSLAAAQARGDREAFFDVVGGALGELKTWNAEHARYAPAKAEVLAFIVDAMIELLRLRKSKDRAAIAAFARGRHAPALALARKHPREVDAYQLGLAAAMLAPDAKIALSLMASPPPAPPEEEQDLHLRRAQVQVALAGLWRDPAAARAALVMLEQVPVKGSGPRGALSAEVRGDAWAIIALHGEVSGATEAWQKARESFGRAIHDADESHRAKLLNNLGVVAARLGDAANAKTSWEAVAAYASDRKWVSRVNLASLDAAAGKWAEAREALDKLATEQANEAGEAGKPAPESSLPVELLHWLRAAAKAERRAARVKELDKVLRAATAKAKREQTFGAPPSGPRSLHTFGLFQLNLGAASLRESYVLELVLAGEPWLILPAPAR